MSSVQKYNLVENQRNDMCGEERFKTPEKHKTRPTNYGP